MDQLKLKIGRRVKEYREKRRYSQEAFAEKVGLSLSAISRLETGKTMVSISTLLEIADALEVGVERILQDFITTTDQQDAYVLELCRLVSTQDEACKKLILEVTHQICSYTIAPSKKE